MDISSLGLLALAAVGLGAIGTYLMAQRLGAPIAAAAAEHGRYVGLGEAAPGVAPRRGAQHETINGIRTAS